MAHFLTQSRARVAEHVQGHPARREPQGHGAQRAGLWVQGQRERRRGAPPQRRRALPGRALRAGAGDLDAQRVLRPRRAPTLFSTPDYAIWGLLGQQWRLRVSKRLMRCCVWLLCAVAATVRKGLFQGASRAAHVQRCGLKMADRALQATWTAPWQQTASRTPMARRTWCALPLA